MRRLAAVGVLCAALTANAGAAPAIAVSQAWSRPALETGVVYVRVVNSGAAGDRLIGARATVARAVELHRSMIVPATMQGMAMNDVSSMTPVSALPVAARGTLTLAPGGAHIMLIGLRRDLRAGETFPLQLHFARAGWVNAIVHVRPI